MQRTQSRAARSASPYAWSQRILVVAAFVAGAGLVAPASHAGEAEAATRPRGLVLPTPETFGVFPATTYDESGDRIGESRLSLQAGPDGLVDIHVSTGADDGARTIAKAQLVRLPDDSGVRILSEQSQSVDDAGKPLGLLRIDHSRGVGTCTPAGGGEDDTVVFELAPDERVVNVPLNLLFVPLVQGDVEEIEFQYFLCRGGPRVLDFQARRAEVPVERDGRSIIEISYGPDLGQMVSWLARSLMPKLSFWFEADGDGTTYVAHRMPLFSKGPEVTVVREGRSASPFLTGR